MLKSSPRDTNTDIPTQINIELSYTGPDIQSDPDQLENQAFAQSGTQLLIISALTPSSQ